MTIIDWFPKNKRREFWVMDLTSLYRFITAYIRHADQDGWADYFASYHIVRDKYYPGLADLVCSYALSVFRRRLREGKRKHGCVLKVISNCLAAPKYMFQYELDMCKREDGRYEIQESLPIWYWAKDYMKLLPKKICPSPRHPGSKVIVRPVPLFGRVLRRWTNEVYAPYVTMLIETPWEEKRKMVRRMWLKENI